MATAKKRHAVAETASEESDVKPYASVPVAVGIDDPVRRAHLIEAGKLPADMKRVLWRNLQKTVPGVTAWITASMRELPGSELRVELKGHGERLHRILKEKEQVVGEKAA